MKDGDERQGEGIEKTVRITRRRVKARDDELIRFRPLPSEFYEATSLGARLLKLGARLVEARTSKSNPEVGVGEAEVASRVEPSAASTPRTTSPTHDLGQAWVGGVGALEFMKQKELMKLLRKSRSQIFRYRKRFKDFPTEYRIGGTLLFRVDEVVAWIEKHQDSLDG